MSKHPSQFNFFLDLFHNKTKKEKEQENPHNTNHTHKIILHNSCHEEMNGKERIELQELAGVREIVCDLENLKLKFLSQNIQVLTPKVEINLRLGRIAQIPLKLSYSRSCSDCSSSSLGDSNYSIILKYPMKYPFEELSIEFIFAENSLFGEEIQNNVKEISLNFIRNNVGEKGYSLELIELINNYLDSFKTQMEVIKNENIEQKNEENFNNNFNNNNNNNNSSLLPSQDQLNEEYNQNNQQKQDIQLPPQPYKCKKCRHTLFYSCHIEHNFSKSSSSSRRCSSIFLKETPFFDSPILEFDNEIQWLHNTFQNLSNNNEICGKIFCPFCSSKIGSWNLSGDKCSCGDWIAPSIQFSGSKIDNPNQCIINNL